jgi:hypothetical protein
LSGLSGWPEWKLNQMNHKDQTDETDKPLRVARAQGIHRAPSCSLFLEQEDDQAAHTIRQQTQYFPIQK